MKEWVKPELIVLVRSNAEESVLITCKSGTHVAAGESTYCWTASVQCDRIGAS